MEDSAEVIVRRQQLRATPVARPYEVVRARRRIVTEERTVTVAVRREELVLERIPVTEDRGLAPGGDDVLEIVLHEEEVVMQTRVVPRELVRVHKERITEPRQVAAELRREQIGIETDGAVRRVEP